MELIVVVGAWTARRATLISCSVVAPVSRATETTPGSVSNILEEIPLRTMSGRAAAKAAQANDTAAPAGSG
ncbi:hypothetical protein [Microbispora sp. NPDC046933]|uniref:hypothetical protein n=1 Tax=Microbispora sp. NPDC046933 TaxID=3155618 RepID=UPI0033CC94F2